ncbi:MAG: hypothetical protein IRZ05_08970 [Micromonosporaceae bacterium]|jgi:hypothetical protein|nr:hypothetical protein [Micromonosporaceae bacterium]
MSQPVKVTTPSHARSSFGAAAATIIAMAALAGFWWLAVPRHDLCVATLPAPAGCRTADRVPTAILWTVIVVVLYVAITIVAFVRPRGRWWPFMVGIATLIGAALWGYRRVLYAA